MLIELRHKKRIYYAKFSQNPLKSIGGATFDQSPKQSTKHGLHFNLLTPNVNYSGRTAPLTSKVAFYIFIQQI